MAKLYVPYDYKTINRGFYEVEVPDNLLVTYLNDIRDGSFDVASKGKKLPSEVVFDYDPHVFYKDVIEESKYLEEKSFKEVDKGFTVNGGTRD